MWMTFESLFETLPPLHHSRKVWNCHDLCFPLLWHVWPGQPKQQLWGTCMNSEDRFALSAIFIFVRIITEANFYRIIPKNAYSLEQLKLFPKIRYCSKIDICSCLRFTENYLNLGCLENYWFLGGSNAKQRIPSYVDNYSNSFMCVTLVPLLAENAELTLYHNSFFALNVYINAQWLSQWMSPILEMAHDLQEVNYHSSRWGIRWSCNVSCYRTSDTATE